MAIVKRIIRKNLYWNVTTLIILFATAVCHNFFTRWKSVSMWRFWFLWKRISLKQGSNLGANPFLPDQTVNCFEEITSITFGFSCFHISLRKNICLKHFLWCKEMLCFNETKFVWLKKNIFGPNEYVFEPNKFLP